MLHPCLDCPKADLGNCFINCKEYDAYLADFYGMRHAFSEAKEEAPKENPNEL